MWITSILKTGKTEGANIKLKNRQENEISVFNKVCKRMRLIWLKDFVKQKTNDNTEISQPPKKKQRR